MTGIIVSDNTQYLATLALPDFLQSDLIQCSKLPSLPMVAIRVLEVAGYPDATLNDYAHAIEQDPALTLRLISLANSAFYARNHTETHSCLEATSRLGLDATLAAVMSFSLWRDRRADDQIQSIWGRSIVSALAARYLAEQLCPDQSSFVFTAALLQDIGMLALLAAYPRDAQELYVTAPLSHSQISDGERTRFGCDHPSVGGWLAARWGCRSPGSGDQRQSRRDQHTGWHALVMPAPVGPDCRCLAVIHSQPIARLVNPANCSRWISPLRSR